MGSTPTRSRHNSPAPHETTILTGSLLRACLVLLGIFLAAAPASAQEPAPPDTVGVAAEADVAQPSVVLDPTGPPVVVDSVGRPVSAMGAFWRSLLVPGWGQAVVGQPGRGAFYFTMEAASLWMLIKTSEKKSAAERAGDEDLAAARKDQQEDWIVLAVFWSLFSAVDAWVSAHMWDFEGAVVPPPDGSAGVAVQYSVPVNIP